ncbi:Hint domain-containing protein [Actibacterium sp. MT2.3-13A]|uniref:Hint domain-containing protein n=1 Tax=Actibacterium sp. MT2.3-13A TaxID=2828332 RepID=UPI001BAE0C43|nr:Hint domain-containing protein [Actibacterium sp. MT2.3-13A]
MSSPARGDLSPSYACHVFPADEFEVVSGANLGDPLMPLDELCPGDVYEFLPGAEALELAIHDGAAARAGSGQFLQPGARGQSVATGSEIGRPGESLRLEGRLTFMRPDGDTVDLLLIALTGAGGGAAQLVFVPMAPIEARQSYTLVKADPEPGEVRLTDITSVAFTRGTMITLGDGRQCPVEDLRPGDRVLTRDHGAQPLRWVGHRTVRAVGPFAPVVITKGTYANQSDLIVSQHQRLFLYQRGAQRLTETAELFVKALHLVDGEAVFLRAGGFVEYFHLVFDRHEIIYAECIPTESLLINERTLGQLPEEVLREVETHLPGLSHRPHFGTEAEGRLLRKLGPTALAKATNRD